jgi:large subunit ribosomal protein L19
MDLVRYFEQQQTKDIARPLLKAGDVVRVHMKVQEGGKARLQAFEGTILGIRGSGPSTTFTVRRETGHFGVERVFPLYSPLITNIEVVRRQKVRRARLTYLRDHGRRRFKEDVRAMQRHIKAEEEKRRLAATAEKKRAAEEEEAAKKAEQKAESMKEEGEVHEGKPQAEQDMADQKSESKRTDAGADTTQSEKPKASS